jgi:hypothetical protein
MTSRRATQRISSLVGQRVTTVVPADGALKVVVPVGLDRAFRLDPGPGCTPSPLIAAVQVPGSPATVSIDLGSCTDDRVLGTGPQGGQLVITLRALGTDVPASLAVVYTPIQTGPFANGSFETPVVDAAFRTLQAGQTIGPWTVSAGEVDQLSTWATPKDGRQSVDRAMNRPSSVTPAVEPSQPVAPGASSWTHRSSAARACPASDTCP